MRILIVATPGAKAAAEEALAPWECVLAGRYPDAHVPGQLDAQAEYHLASWQGDEADLKAATAALSGMPGVKVFRGEHSSELGDGGTKVDTVEKASTVAAEDQRWTKTAALAEATK